MSFNPNAPLDPGQVTDVRGSRFGGRRHWFSVGYQQGTAADCDTFHATI
jgi:hypothetical protein